MFLKTGGYSGAENVACQIISMLNEKVDFVYSSLDGPIRNILEKKKIPFVPLSSNSLLEYRKVIRAVKPDIIHAHDMGASLYAALSCKKTPLILHIHNNAFDSRGVSVKSLLFCIAACKAKHIFWVSESSYLGYYFHDKFTKKSTILYNIVDVDAVHKLAFQENKTIKSYDVIYIGRLTYQKNPQRLILVLKGIISKMPEAKAVIIGSGELKEQILKLIRLNKLEDNISYLGFLDNPYPILKNSKVMLMTSRWEGLPMSCLEALALGVPIVTTPVDGINKIVINGVNGFKSENNVILEEKVIALLKDQELYKKMSFEAKRISLEMNDKKKYKDNIEQQYFSKKEN